jgi:hypothetical protein
MSETATEPHVNGTAPPAPPAAEQPCENCASPSEKALAVLAFLAGAFVVVIAIDMFFGGRLTGMVKEQVQQ